MTGETTEEELRAAFAEQARALAEGGADALVVETMSDLDEARIALEAAKSTGLPVVACMVFDTGKNKDRTMMGATPEQAAGELTAAGADVVGANCGVGIESYVAICRRLQAADRPAHLDQGQRRASRTGGRQDGLEDDARGVRRLRSAARRGRREFHRRLLRHQPGVHSRRRGRYWLLTNVRLKLISCEIFYREMCAAVARSPHQVDIEFLPKGLHDIGSAKMSARLQEAVDAVDAAALRSRPARLRAVRQRPGWADGADDSAGAPARPRLHHALPGQQGALPGVLPEHSRRVLQDQRMDRARRDRAAG